MESYYWHDNFKDKAFAKIFKKRNIREIQKNCRTSIGEERLKRAVAIHRT